MKVIVNDILLNHVESGHPHGVPVLLIHGFPFSHTMWDPQLELLPNIYRLIAYDIRGFGQSDLGNGDKTIDQHADDLIGLMDDLKISKAIIIGLSMGGYIALRAIEKHPERFSGLILCDTKSESDTNEARQKRHDSIEKIKKEGLDNFTDEFLKNVLTAETLQNKQFLVKELKQKIQENKPEGIIAAQYAMSTRVDTTNSLRKIKVPVLILIGAEDKLIPIETVEKMRDKIPNARVEIIPNAAHLSNVENPEFFNKKVIEYLERFKE